MTAQGVLEAGQGHVLAGLERVASVTRDYLILETVVDLVGLRRPAMAFYPNRELNNDPTNWWAPNEPCIEAMARVAGFRITARPGHEIYLCEPNPREAPFTAWSRDSELEAIFGGH